jgi:hypothetical protein
MIVSFVRGARYMSYGSIVLSALRFAELASAGRPR